MTEREEVRDLLVKILLLDQLLAILMLVNIANYIYKFGGIIMTVTLLTSPSCTSCRKAKQWLRQHEVDFVEQNIFVQAPSTKQLKWILKLTENGTEDIISRRSKDYNRFKEEIDSMTVRELISKISEHPGLLRRPILFDDKRLQVGFNDDEIRRFLPRHIRTAELERAKRSAGIY